MPSGKNLYSLHTCITSPIQVLGLREEDFIAGKSPITYTTQDLISKYFTYWYLSLLLDAC